MNGRAIIGGLLGAGAGCAVGQVAAMLLALNDQDKLERAFGAFVACLVGGAILGASVAG